MKLEHFKSDPNYKIIYYENSKSRKYEAIIKNNKLNGFGIEYFTNGNI
jgi:antitoxin component YwqK of YwqJK toxin-antitoxin module